MSIAYHLFFAAFLLLLTIVNYYVGRKNVLYPGFLLSLLWFAIFCLLTLPLIEVDRIGTDTLGVVVIGVIAFSAGSALMRPHSSRPAVVQSWSTSLCKKAFLALSLTVLPIFFYEVWKLSGFGGPLELLLSARDAMIEAFFNGETAVNPLLNIAPPFAVFTALIFMIEAGDWSGERAWVTTAIVVAIIYTILTTGRTLLLELVLALSGIHILKTGRTSATQAWRLVRWPLIGFLVLFSLLVPVLKNTSGLEGGAGEAVSNYAFGYAIIPLAGFDYIFHHRSEYRYEPNHELQAVTDILGPIVGAKPAPAPDRRDFVFTPIPTNVFTVFRSFYADFGIAGIPMMMFAIGAAQTWLFRKAMAGQHLFIFVFALSLFPLVMTAFDDEYLLSVKYLKDSLFAVGYFAVLRTVSFPAWKRSAWPREAKL